MIEVCYRCKKRLNFGKIGDCVVCCNAFDKIDEIIKDILGELKEYEFESFDVGVKLYGSSKAVELLLKEKFGIEDDLKEDFRREFLKKFELISGKPRRINGDIKIILNLEDLSYEIEVKPIYIYGRYKKRVRNLSQTRWICGNCNGKGCELCNYTGRKYLSVEDLIINPALEVFGGDNAFLHGAGREDVDARMLGNGRPFILEVVNPKKRRIDLDYLENAINEYAKNKISVRLYFYCDSKSVEELKNSKFRKRYRAVVRFDGKVERGELIEALKILENSVILQRTPKRVEHRRADKVRERRVYSAKLIHQRDNIAIIEILAESGLYIKELVSGDEGRTKPSLAEILGVDARVEKLDVIDVISDTPKFP